MSGDSGRGGSGWNNHLRPPTMIERHVNNSPASFAQAQYGYGPQEPTSPASFSPGQIVVPRTYNEMDMPSGGLDNDPFAAAAYNRDPSVISQQMGGHDAYLTRQPSQMADEVQPNREPAQMYHADPFQQPQEAEYVDLNRVPSVGAAGAVGVAVSMPAQEVSQDSSSAVVPPSDDAKPTATSPLASQPAFTPTSQSTPPANETVVAPRNATPVNTKRPDTVYTVYDAEDAYGGM
ncbi:uncharacterized protein BT62DRAFT_571189 [Guyanagaster necrorhizus]|uniref:Uncharacterized protein n=1 Tax=Guyanagaster necrorhizus TaxID=856835 RepID=A0A9P7VHN0_9AGAR|nr:uncharacterized protein BT62DRAFT_571189 [Guyanagaster necrorhizus MCA 3950]KAG7440753.1 hypothetical protein BT62DRAFT_571189 [Guyanagaster necrorhizus MCA 3950]